MALYRRNADRVSHWSENVLMEPSKLRSIGFVAVIVMIECAFLIFNRQWWQQMWGLSSLDDPARES